MTSRFQSTRPLRGATVGKGRHISAEPHFNPRAPCGARPLPTGQPIFNTHFNPRAPCGARQDATEKAADKAAISIHAPLAGRDEYPGAADVLKLIFQSTRPLRGATGAMAIIARLDGYFNPRAPCGARRRTNRHHAAIGRFQSTRPLRGATYTFQKNIFLFHIFQSTRPLRGATTMDSRDATPSRFQSTRPLRGAT